MSLDKIVFKDKKFADILEEIYNNQKKKSKQITSMIRELQPPIPSHCPTSAKNLLSLMAEVNKIEENKD